MAEEAAIDLTIRTGEAEQATQSLRAKLKGLKDQLATLPEGKEFDRVSKEAGQLQDKIGDINKRVNNLASDTRKLDAFVGVAQGIAGGFAAAQGAMALFGSENEDLNKSLVKIQGSIALLNGVQQIANLLQKESAVMVNLNAAAQATYTAVVGTSTGALKLFRLALAATGIGLVVILIGALIANWDKLTEAISGSTDELDKNAEATRNNTKAMQEQSKQLEKTAKEDIALAIASWEQVRAIREQQGKDTLEADEKLRELRLMAGATETELKIAQIKDETNRTIEELKARQQAEVEQEKARLQALEDARKQFEEKKQEQLDIEAEIAKMRSEQILADKQADEEALLAISAQALAQASEAQANYERQRDIDAAKAKDRAAARVAVEQGVYSAVSSLTSAIGALGKKNEKLQKALAIVQIAIDTAKAISGAVAQAQSVPYPGNILAIVSGVAAVLANIAAAKQILSKDAGVSAGANPAISTGGGVSDLPTSTNNAPTVPQTPQSIPIPQQVYVTETDISGVQGQVTVIEGLSKIQ